MAQSSEINQSSEMNWRALQGFTFGDNAQLADCLAGLVLAGLKTATCWAAADGPRHTEVGKMMVMKNAAGQPLAVLQTVELTPRRFSEVDATFAFDEGEGDRSLEYWRQAHRRYFTRQGSFAPDMLLCCERFRVVAMLDADQPSDPSRH